MLQLGPNPTRPGENHFFITCSYKTLSRSWPNFTQTTSLLLRHCRRRPTSHAWAFNQFRRAKEPKLTTPTTPTQSSSNSSQSLTPASKVPKTAHQINPAGGVAGNCCDFPPAACAIPKGTSTLCNTHSVRRAPDRHCSSVYRITLTQSSGLPPLFAYCFLLSASSFPTRWSPRSEKTRDTCKDGRNHRPTYLPTYLPATPTRHIALLTHTCPSSHAITLLSFLIL